MPDKFLDVGKIVALHGVRGEVKVLPWADGPEFLCRFDTFYLGGKPYHAQSVRQQNTCVLLKLEGVDEPEAAQALRNQVLRISRTDANIAPGTVFIADLLGLPVRCNGVELGKLCEVLPMPAADVYVVRGEHEYMIPAVREFVPELNPALGYLEVKLIEGMRTDAD